MANVVWDKLSVTVAGKDGPKTILSDVSGCVGAKHMLAIMGPSGSGKTTLLDALSGRLSSSMQRKGTILLNGNASNLSFGLAAYVSQDDLLIGTLTVRETLMFVAKLRMQQGTPRKGMEDRVSAVLDELGLQDAADVPIGNWHSKGISGGQKRRVSIGCELLLSPTLLFLDEPTSGLDAASAFHVMQNIQSLVEKGRTVVSVIHQPSSEVYELFDKLCLLSEGKVVYFGVAAKAVDVFAAAGLPSPPQRNPADHFLHCINTEFQNYEDEKFKSASEQISNLIEAYGKSDIYKAETEECTRLAENGEKYRDAANTGASWVGQVVSLTHRTFLNNMRNFGVFWMRLAMYLMLCICIGTLYFDLSKSWNAVVSRGAMLFFVVAFLTFMSISAFPAFAEDMQIFMRERLNGYYGVSTFVIGNSLAAAPFIFLISLSSSVAVYFLAGLNNDDDRFIYFVVNLFMALCTVEGLMMAIASVVPHYLMGIGAGAGVLGLYMLVCGFFQPVGELPGPVWRYPLHYISFHSYSFNGFLVNEFGDTDGWDCPCSIQVGGCDCSMTGEAVLKSMALKNRNKWIDIGILVGHMVLYRFIFFVMLKIKEEMIKRR